VDTRFAGSGTFEGGLQVVAERSELQTREDGFSRRTLWRRAGTGAVVAGAFIAGSPASMAFAAPANQTDATTLRLNAGSEPDTIDPQKASFVGEIDKIMRVFRNLLQFDKTNTLVPDQAAALPVASDGGKTLTFTLKSGLTYSDGKALTAKDYEYGWKRQPDPAGRGGYSRPRVVPPPRRLPETMPPSGTSSRVPRRTTAPTSRRHLRTTSRSCVTPLV